MAKWKDDDRDSCKNRLTLLKYPFRLCEIKSAEDKKTKVDRSCLQWLHLPHFANFQCLRRPSNSFLPNLSQLPHSNAVLRYSNSPIYPNSIPYGNKKPSQITLANFYSEI